MPFICMLPAPPGVVGPFEGLSHVVKVLDACDRRALRQQLVLLVQALVDPRCAPKSAAVRQHKSSGPHLFVWLLVLSPVAGGRMDSLVIGMVNWSQGKGHERSRTMAYLHP